MLQIQDKVFVFTPSVLSLPVLIPVGRLTLLRRSGLRLRLERGLAGRSEGSNEGRKEGRRKGTKPPALPPACH